MEPGTTVLSPSSGHAPHLHKVALADAARQRLNAHRPRPRKQVQPPAGAAEGGQSICWHASSRYHNEATGKKANRSSRHKMNNGRLRTCSDAGHSTSTAAAVQCRLAAHHAPFRTKHGSIEQQHLPPSHPGWRWEGSRRPRPCRPNGIARRTQSVGCNAMDQCLPRTARSLYCQAGPLSKPWHQPKRHATSSSSAVNREQQR